MRGSEQRTAVMQLGFVRVEKSSWISVNPQTDWQFAAAE